MLMYGCYPESAFKKDLSPCVWRQLQFGEGLDLSNDEWIRQIEGT
jgi:hypothetical protein